MYKILDSLCSKVVNYERNERKTMRESVCMCTLKEPTPDCP